VDEGGTSEHAAFGRRTAPALDQWNPADLAPLIADGTLVGHIFLDDIVNFEGHDHIAADLENMARRSPARLPGLMMWHARPVSESPEVGRSFSVGGARVAFERQLSG
jgi:hypothetical protein